MDKLMLDFNSRLDDRVTSIMNFHRTINLTIIIDNEFHGHGRTLNKV